MQVVQIEIKEIEYELEVELEMEDLKNNLHNLTIHSVTQLNGPKPEHDLDPEVFEQSLADRHHDEIYRKARVQWDKEHLE